MITLKNQLMASLLRKKDEAVQEGRKLTKKLSKIEKEIDDCRKAEHKITKAVTCDDIIEKAEALAKKIDEDVEILESYQVEMRERKIAAIPPKLKDRHEKLLQERKRLEKKRAKLGEQIEKIKEKFVPWLHRRMEKKLPTEFHDIETAKLNKNGDIEVKVFNHLDSFRDNFIARRKAETPKKKKQG